MIELKPIIHTILKGYALPWNGVHGIAHWARVLENGARLATDTGAVLEVVQLFAVFHDSRRVNDHGDYGHGRHGAELATELRGTLFDLPDADFELLYEACADHTKWWKTSASDGAVLQRFQPVRSFLAPLAGNL